MLKVLISDDEPTICDLVCRLVEWEALGLECIGKVQDGLSAERLLQTRQPDIVITDIQMPGISGLELIERAQPLPNAPRFIVISGYRDFEYARRALQFGVEDYLLKPIRKADLNLILQKVIKKCRQSNAQEQERLEIREKLDSQTGILRKAEFQRLLADPEHPLDTALLGFQERKPACCIALHVGLLYPEDLEKQSWGIVQENTCARLQKLLFPAPSVWAAERAAAYLLFQPERAAQEYLPQIQSLLKKLAVQYAHVQLTAAIGAEVPAAQSAAAIQAAKQTLSARLVFGGGKTLHYEQFRQLPEGVPLDFPESARQKLAAALEALQPAQAQELLDVWHYSLMLRRDEAVCGLYEKAKGLAGFVDRTLQASAAEKPEDWDGLYNCDSIQTIGDWLGARVRSRIEATAKQLQNREAEPIRLAKRYVEEHISRQLSLEEVAAQSYVSAGYFSALFKEKTGETFSDYVIRMRVEASKKLLREGRCTIGEAAQQVGYADSRHFSKVFARIVGMKPAAYRKFYS